MPPAMLLGRADLNVRRGFPRAIPDRALDRAAGAQAPQEVLDVLGPDVDVRIAFADAPTADHLHPIVARRQRLERDRAALVGGRALRDVLGAELHPALRTGLACVVDDPA